MYVHDGGIPPIVHQGIDLRFIIVFFGFILWIFSIIASEENFLELYLFAGFVYILFAMLAEILPWLALPLLTFLVMIIAIIFSDPSWLYSKWHEASDINISSGFFVAYNLIVALTAIFALGNHIKTNKK